MEYRNDEPYTAEELHYSEKKTPLIEDGKLFGCIPMQLLQELAKVYAFGAAKHTGLDSWQQHTDTQYWNSKVKRHALQIQSGRAHDAESGLLHAMHIAMDALCLAHAQLQKEQDK